MAEQTTPSGDQPGLGWRRRWLLVFGAWLVLGPSSAAQAQILDIGDSHTVLAGTAVAHPAWEVDAESGRDSTAGLEVLRQRLRRRHRQVVFDLATTDHSEAKAFAHNLRRVWALIGPDRELILVTSLIPGWTGAMVNVNAEIREFAHLHPQRVTVARWNRLASAHPEWWTDDGVHFTQAGYRARSRLILKAIHG